MTFRRLSLVLALLSAPVDADVLDDAPLTEDRSVEFERSSLRRTYSVGATLRNLLLHPDGSITAAVASGSSGVVPWDLVHLVLADFERGVDESEGPVWVRLEPDRLAAAGQTMDGYGREDAPIALSALAGAAVDVPGGRTMGFVSGALVYWATGRVLALAVDAGPDLGSPARTLALPWTWLRFADARGAIRSITAQVDSQWFEDASQVVLTHSLR